MKPINRKPKIEKMKSETEKKERVSSLVFSGIALVITIALFVGLIFVQNALTNDVVYQAVIVAKEDVPEGTLVDASNAAALFEKKNVNVLDATSGYMTVVDGILDCRTKVALNKGEIVSAKDFSNDKAFVEGIENPVEISVSVENIADADGGRIRAGDVVNLSMIFTTEQLRQSDTITTASTAYSPVTGVARAVSIEIGDEDGEAEGDAEAEDGEAEAEVEEDEEPALPISSPMLPSQLRQTDAGSRDSEYKFEGYSRYVAQNLYVVDALDASGLSIPASDRVTPVSILVFVIEKDDEPDFNNALANCKHKRVSRVVEKPADVTAPTITIEDGVEGEAPEGAEGPEEAPAEGGGFEF